MVVTVVDQGLEIEAQRSRPPDMIVADVGGVRPRLHPHPFFQEQIATGVGPDRCRALQAKTLEVKVTLWICGAVDPTINEERVLATVTLEVLVELGDQEGTLQRRFEGGDE